MWLCFHQGAAATSRRFLFVARRSSRESRRTGSRRQLPKRSGSVSLAQPPRPSGPRTTWFPRCPQKQEFSTRARPVPWKRNPSPWPSRKRQDRKRGADRSETASATRVRLTTLWRIRGAAPARTAIPMPQSSTTECRNSPEPSTNAMPVLARRTSSQARSTLLSTALSTRIPPQSRPRPGVVGWNTTGCPGNPCTRNDPPATSKVVPSPEFVLSLQASSELARTRVPAVISNVCPGPIRTVPEMCKGPSFGPQRRVLPGSGPQRGSFADPEGNVVFGGGFLCCAPEAFGFGELSRSVAAAGIGEESIVGAGVSGDCETIAPRNAITV